MTKVTASNITPAHIKAARALLDWNASDLAIKSNVGAATVRRFESGRKIHEKSREEMIGALQNAGIAFQNGGHPGVRFKLPHNQFSKTPKWGRYLEYKIRPLCTKGEMLKACSESEATIWAIDGLTESEGSDTIHDATSRNEAEILKALYERLS